jgi:hypothetical protein
MSKGYAPYVSFDYGGITYTLNLIAIGSTVCKFGGCVTDDSKIYIYSLSVTTSNTVFKYSVNTTVSGGTTDMGNVKLHYHA